MLFLKFNENLNGYSDIIFNIFLIILLFEFSGCKLICILLNTYCFALDLKLVRVLNCNGFLWVFLVIIQNKIHITDFMCILIEYIRMITNKLKIIELKGIG